jgi:hypothetical protein
MARTPKDYLIYGDLLVTFKCPLFPRRDKLDARTRIELLAMPGIHPRGAFKSMTSDQCRMITGLKRIRARGRWKKISGTLPVSLRPRCAKGNNPHPDV